jgi:hypothetical protein
LDDIINSQIPNHDKSGLGYNQIENGSSSKSIEQETYRKIYAETIKGDRKTYNEDYRDTLPSKRFRFQNQRPTETKKKKNRPQEEEVLIRVTPFKRSSTPRYQNIFLVLCYACNNFGHKVVNCRANSRNIKNFEICKQNGYPRRPSET